MLKDEKNITEILVVSIEEHNAPIERIEYRLNILFF